MNGQGRLPLAWTGSLDGHMEPVGPFCGVWSEVGDGWARGEGDFRIPSRVLTKRGPICFPFLAVGRFALALVVSVRLRRHVNDSFQSSANSYPWGFWAAGSCSLTVIDDDPEMTE